MQLSKRWGRLLPVKEKKRERLRETRGRPHQSPRSSLKVRPKGKLTERMTIHLKRLPSLLGIRAPRSHLPSQVLGKGMMTSAGPIIGGPRCLLTHKDYAVKEVKTLIKPMDVDPCAELGIKELGESALFYLTRVSSLPQLILSRLFLLFFFFKFYFYWWLYLSSDLGAC